MTLSVTNMFPLITFVNSIMFYVLIVYLFLFNVKNIYMYVYIFTDYEMADKNKVLNPVIL